MANWKLLSSMIILFTLWVLTVTAAPAQTIEQNWNTCESRDLDYADAIIAACTVLINSGAGDVKHLSAAYENRGSAYGATAQNDKALADYRTAIQIDPSNASAKDGLARLEDLLK